MKVTIGPYRNGIRAYPLLDKLDPLIGEDRVDKLFDVVQPILDKTVNRVIERPRTVKVKLHPYDTWNTFETLAYIIVPLLKQYIETTHGSPFTDDDDVPVELKSTSAPPLSEKQKNSGEVDDFHHSRWKWIVGEMIWAFEQCTQEWEDQYYSGVSDIRFLSNGDGWGELVEGPNHTFKLDEDGKKKHLERMQNGFRLFSKYYLSLWD